MAAEKQNQESQDLFDKQVKRTEIKSRITALYQVLGDIYGSERLVLRAIKLGVVKQMRSKRMGEQVMALQKLIHGDPTLEKAPQIKEIPEILDELEDTLAQAVARRLVEEDLERKISEKLQERQEEYLNDMKAQLLREKGSPENANTLKKLAFLEKKKQINLNASVSEVLRPRTLNEIIGQEKPLKALIAKLAAPHPQHILLYGPPGVGKTSAARIALEHVKKMRGSTFQPDAPFVEVDGTTLRWDPRDVTNPLLGSVHDPIYQGARRDLAETGIPEPKLGLVTEAHGGILFIDEIGDVDPILQNKLLKVLEDKKVFFESSYYEPGDPMIPEYIKKLFDEGAPADFVLIGATTRNPDQINPAFRSRCAEIFFDCLTPQDIQNVLKQAAGKLKVVLEPGVAEAISEYTIEARKATNILVDAHAMARYRQKNSRRKTVRVTMDDLQEVLQISRLTPYVTRRAETCGEIGHVFGLAVSGFVGTIIEIEAVAFPAGEQQRGTVRFNGAAGSMAKDSVFNALAVYRAVTGKNAADYDIHVNIVGGGRVDGPSAGAAIFLAIYSAIEGIPLRQDVAITGEISIQGQVRGVGSITEKLYGARQVGVKKVLIPADNSREFPEEMWGVQVVSIDKITDAFPHILIGEKLEEN
ncbi:MAG: Lon family ATP-dependent protease [Thermoanaerobacterales bacterium]|nr:Lon family ATP-dependent protease [Thermoanaerobacterales bacterium]